LLLCLTSLAALLPLCASPQEEGKRVALIIGNDNYKISQLKNAVNDARAMEKALQAAGFKTLLVENAKRADMDRNVGQFVDMLGPDDTALFFYAGHGVQIENENFLVPVDFEPGDSISSAKFSCFSLAQLYEQLARRRAKRRIVILDACRSNPVANKYSLEAGLARPQRDDLKESFIVYSTGPGQVAADNPDGRNSWFTEGLSGMIGQASLTLDEVFNRVKRQVSEETSGKQTPWVSSTMTSSFYFHPPLNSEGETDLSLTAKRMDEAKRFEQAEEWDRAIELVNQVLAKKPGGLLEEDAKSKLPYLKAHKDAQARYEASDFVGAAESYKSAIQMDPFAIQTAFQGVNSYLLADRIGDAVKLLQAVRVRGTSDAIQRANAMLKELAAVSPEAGTELKAGIPQPPPIEEVFRSTRFGVPDWEAGSRDLHAANIDTARWSKDLLESAAKAAAAIPAAPAATPAETPLAENPIALAILHVEVSSTAGTRDLVIRKIGPGTLNSGGTPHPGGVAVKVTSEPPGAELTVEGDAEQHCQTPCMLNLPAGRQVVHAQLPGFRMANRILTVAAPSDLQIELERQLGMVQFDGIQEGTPVLVDGKPAVFQGASKLALGAGTYEVKVVQDGKTLSRQNVEVKDQSTVPVSVKQ
jgi:tetratricopeptide (TPR) repeat protein